jgi:hypothetical protein
MKTPLAAEKRGLKTGSQYLSYYAQRTPEENARQAPRVPAENLPSA